MIVPRSIQRKNLCLLWFHVFMPSARGSVNIWLNAAPPKQVHLTASRSRSGSWNSLIGWFALALDSYFQTRGCSGSGMEVNASNRSSIAAYSAGRKDCPRHFGLGRLSRLRAVERAQAEIPLDELNDGNVIPIAVADMSPLAKGRNDQAAGIRVPSPKKSTG